MSLIAIVLKWEKCTGSFVVKIIIVKVELGQQLAISYKAIKEIPEEEEEGKHPLLSLNKRDSS